MVPLEKQLLENFLQQLTAAQAGQKDAEADALIRQACARQPDAAYLLVQRAMQLEQAYEASRNEVQKLEAELQQARATKQGGFINDPYAWGSQTRSPATAPATGNASGRQPVPGLNAAPGVGPAARGRTAPPPWGGAGMLGTIASTAAGVVAGSFLFQGIQNMMQKDDPTASAESSPVAQNETPPQDAPEEFAQEDSADFSGDSYADAGDGGGDFG
jgi:uncharacterized protein